MGGCTPTVDQPAQNHLWKRGSPMRDTELPSALSAVIIVRGGGTDQRTKANHWKQWDAKPEAKARKRYARSVACRQNRGNPATQSQRLRDVSPMLVRLQAANHRKRWDAKPEATGPLVGPTLDRLHGKPGETRRRKARGYGASPPSRALRSFGYRILFASECTTLSKERKNVREEIQ